MPINARGAFSRPFSIVSRYLSLPAFNHSPTRRSGHQYRLARFRIADVQQPKISREARHSENAERRRDRRRRRVHEASAFAVADRVLLPAEAPFDGASLRKLGMLRFEDLPHGP